MWERPESIFQTRLFAGTALTLLLLAVLIPKGEDVLWVNGHNSPFLDSFFSLITLLGEGWIYIAAIVVLPFIRFYDSIGLILTGILNGLLISFFKRVLFANAGRPITLLDKDLLHFVPGVQVHSAHSFPSGHTATIFALVVFLALLSSNRIWIIAMLCIALLVGYSRMYLLQHFLLDVGAGALMGSFSAYVVHTYFTYRGIPRWMQSRLEVKIRLNKSPEPLSR